MKKLMIITAILFAFSCSEDDCRDDKAKDKEMYEGILENERLTPEQRNSIQKQMELSQKEFPC